MIITTTGGVSVETRGRSAITYEKILKRWYAVYSLRGTRGKETCRVAVKRIATIKAGRLK